MDWPKISPFYDPVITNASALRAGIQNKTELSPTTSYLQLVQLRADGLHHFPSADYPDDTARLSATDAFLSHDARASFFFLKVDSHWEEHYFCVKQWAHPSTGLSVSTRTLRWVLDKGGVHPAFVEAINAECGYRGTFTSYDADGAPEYFHIVVQLPNNGRLWGTVYLRVALQGGRTVGVFADPAEAYSGDETLLEHFMKQYQDGKGEVHGLSPLLNALEFLHQRLFVVGNHWIREVTTTERLTGKGALNRFLRGRQVDYRAITPSMEEEWHFNLNFLRSSIVAAQFQVELIDFLITANKKLQKYRSGAMEDVAMQRLSKHRYKAVKESLCALRSKDDGLLHRLEYFRDRAMHQIDATDSIFTRAIADESCTITRNTHRDSKNIAIIGTLQVVYLAFTFVAQVFSTGFFILPNRDVKVLTVDSSVWIMVLVGVGLTIGMVLVLDVSSHLHLRRRAWRWMRQAAWLAHFVTMTIVVVSWNVVVQWWRTNVRPARGSNTQAILTSIRSPTRSEHGIGRTLPVHGQGMEV